MKLLRGVTISVVVFGTMVAAASCGKTADGTDSNTHWLDECDSDSDCGNLSCLCGVCSRECSGEHSCDGLGSDAICGGACSTTGKTSCVRGSQGTGGGQAATGGTASTGGARASGGAGGNSAGAGGTGGVPESGPCAPMNARDNPTFCGNDAAALPTLYHWNGRTCLPSTCCTGPDCVNRYDTAEACDEAHSACYTGDGIARTCTTSTDCILATRTCCFCGETGADDVLAIRSDSQRTWTGNSCAENTGECPPCVWFENPYLSAVCLEGQCKTLDVSDLVGCSGDDDCVLMEKSCCGAVAAGTGNTCNSTTSKDQLITTTRQGVTPVKDVLCAASAPTICDACEAPIPEDVRARCDTNVRRCYIEDKVP